VSRHAPVLIEKVDELPFQRFLREHKEEIKRLRNLPAQLRQKHLPIEGTLADSSWAAEEEAFITRKLRPYLPDKEAEAKRYLERVEALRLALWEIRDQRLEAGSRVVFAAIESLGPIVLYPTQWEDTWDPWVMPPEIKARAVELLREIRGLMWERIRGLYFQVRETNDSNRRKAAGNWLRAFGRALAGDTRGSTLTVIPSLVLFHYFKTIFRLGRAQRFLSNDKWPVELSRGDKIQISAEACGLPKEVLLLFLNLDDEGAPIPLVPDRRRINPGQYRRLPIEKAALRWTAKLIGAGEKTIRNKISVRKSSRQ
jgi:hypothetical protein